jgi:hypothetical protein
VQHGRTLAQSFGYDSIGERQARARAESLVHRVGLSTDDGLQSRLLVELRAWLVPTAAGSLSGHVDSLYVLLAHGHGVRIGEAVDPDLLTRSVVLAWTRPEQDPCWRDYLAVDAAINARLAQARREYRPAPLRSLWRALTGTRPDPSALDAGWLAPITAASKAFAARWSRTAIPD